MKYKLLVAVGVMTLGFSAIFVQAEPTTEDMYVNKAYSDQVFIDKEKFEKIVDVGLLSAPKDGFNADGYRAWADRVFAELSERMPVGIYLDDIHRLMLNTLEPPKTREEGEFGRLFYAAADLAIKEVKISKAGAIDRAKRDYRASKIRHGMSLAKAKRIMGVGGECHKDTSGDKPVRICNWKANIDGFFKPHAATYRVIHYVKADMNDQVIDVGSYSYM